MYVQGVSDYFNICIVYALHFEPVDCGDQTIQMRTSYHLKKRIPNLFFFRPLVYRLRRGTSGPSEALPIDCCRKAKPITGILGTRYLQ